MPRNVPVGAVCHGVLLLAGSIDPSIGRSVLYGRRTTALTAELELGGGAMTRLWLGDCYRLAADFVDMVWTVYRGGG